MDNESHVGVLHVLYKALPSGGCGGRCVHSNMSQVLYLTLYCCVQYIMPFEST